MPLSADQTVVATSKDLVSTLQEAFHTPPGFRPAHAKGLLLTGHFTPTSIASTLTTAPHFNSPTTQVLARFSSSTGLPQIPDTDPNGNPRGFAIRFVLGNHIHTDIIAHSTPFFPTRTGAEFLEMLHAIGNGTIGSFLDSHPAAKTFVAAPKPFPDGFERQKYFGVNAYKLINDQGKVTVVRYFWVPVAGEKFLSDEEVENKGPEYLFKGIISSVLTGGGVRFKLMVQVAEDGDVINDATVHWPDSRKVVELGEVVLDGVREDSEAEQKEIIYDPIPRVQGIEPSDDPLLDMRASVYLISGKERRAA